MGRTYRAELPSLWASGDAAPRYEPSPHQHPPYSVLDAAGGWWQQRRAYWLAMGARDAGARPTVIRRGPSSASEQSGNIAAVSAESQFSPVLAELLIAWYSKPGDLVWDPFCGGPTRGFVAETMGRDYRGVDIRAAQVEANRAAYLPLARSWSVGDGRTSSPGRAALTLTCPPYHDLEIYSDQADDLSTLDWPGFVVEHGRAITNAAAVTNGFVVWVVGDLRGPDGSLRGLPDVVAGQMRACGLVVWNRHVLRSPLVTAQMRWARAWDASRKMTMAHSEVIVGLSLPPKEPRG